MEYLLNELERIIDEIESTDDYDQDEVIQILKKYKEEFEEFQLRKEEEKGLEWEDLD
jgi:hypothetical protein